MTPSIAQNAIEWGTQELCGENDDGGDAVFRIFAMAEAERRGRCRNRKWMGDVAEGAFLYKAMEMGMVVSKPWGDNARYDFAVDTGKKLLRVQVKSTSCLCGDRYAVAAHGSDPTVGYTPEEVDVLVAQVPPEEAW